MWSEHENSEWFLKSFNIPVNYRGAVAVHGKIESIEIRNILEEKPVIIDARQNSKLEKLQLP